MSWPCELRSNISWLNTSWQKNGELAMVHMAVRNPFLTQVAMTLTPGSQYGNEASLRYHYSHVALLISVPSSRDRTEKLKTLGRS